MNSPWLKFELLYITLELESAFLIAAGDNDRVFDSVFVTDANGLPCIPGESLAGVLRHALAGDGDPEKDKRCQEVFGYQDRSEGQSSRVRVSYAQVHDQNDRPVAFRGAFRGAQIKDDPVLRTLIAGVGRDHVRIGQHGVAEDKGKFDERLVPAGARFTFELAVSKDAGISRDELIELLSRPEVRIGGKTRRGMGRFKVVRALAASFDLTQKEDLERLAKLPVAIEKAVDSELLQAVEVKAKTRAKTSYLNGVLKLKPVGTWMIGGGSPTGREPKQERGEEDSGKSSWDRLPLSEPKIEWANLANGRSQGSVAKDLRVPYLLPASSVKGAVRHRTAFHARRLKKLWYKCDPAEYANFEESEMALFGVESHRKKQQGKPGIVYFSDVYLSRNTPLQALQHVSLDRFTQGPMDHMLYDEIALVGGELEIELSVDAALLKDEIARKAFQAALQDLCQGRLSVGVGRGHGRFKGELSWQDGKSLELVEVGAC